MSTSNCSSENPVPVDKENLKLNLGEVKKLIYEYKGNPADIGKMLQINSVLLTIGFVKERSATLKFVIAQGVNDLPVEKTSDEFQFYRYFCRRFLLYKIHLPFTKYNTKYTIYLQIEYQ